MGCVLRAFGKDFNVDEFLGKSTFSPCAIFHKGEPRSKRNKEKLIENSGFNLEVSVADFGEFEQQMSDAIRFLQQKNTEIKNLGEFPGVEKIYLDFAVNISQDIFSRSFRFNNQILKEAVCNGVEIEISVYKTETER